MQKRILIVDDEAKIREVMKSYLERDGFLTEEATSGSEALVLFREQAFDLIILDLMLPDVSGESVCQQIRLESNIPIIMLTAKVAEEFRINGLTIGADDYVTKPFSPRELMARIKVIFRRVNTTRSLDSEMRFDDGDLVIHEQRVQVTKKQNPINLTPKEFQLLLKMAKHPGRTFSREELIELVFGFDYAGDTRAIDQHVKNLRQKIEDDPKTPVYLITVFGAGYQFKGGGSN